MTIMKHYFIVYKFLQIVRYGKEGELNAGALFLGSEEASYVTGVILPIDGGYTCI